tara:strand:- start:487 stop:687 length:201 start_codon:yes stop_codon:yes gene_type:complete
MGHEVVYVLTGVSLFTFAIISLLGIWGVDLRIDPRILSSLFLFVMIGIVWSIVIALLGKSGRHHHH